MKTQRIVLHLISVALLLIWGGIMLYFYVSGRIVNYLPPITEGWFRPMALAGGIGLIILGIFNLATMGAEDAGCDDCGHDHSHDHDHKEGGCCGHDHDHGHAHDHHHHEHEGDCCGHSHAQESKNADCCGHDHSHGHEHHHGHAHQHDHAHGILEESGPLGRTVAILILGVPIVLAAAMTPDRFSARAVVNKGLYTPNYNDTSRADQFSLRKTDDKKAAATPNVAAAKPKVQDTPPEGTAALPPGTVVNPSAMPPTGGERVPGSAAPASAAKEVTTAAAPPAGTAPGTAAPAKAAAQSYGSFTLEDLKQQVPMSKDGNFILEVPELYYTAGDLEVQKVLTGQMIETTAQVLPEKVNNADGKRLRVFRLLVQCCAADARPFSVPVEFKEKAPAIKEMAWVKLVGKMNYKQEGGQTVPLIEATKIEETTEPDSSMLY